MMNGEGEGGSETLPEAVCLNDDKLDGKGLTCKVSNQQLLDRNNDVSPVSSRYSSCGESEFDRYCSANSAMGTPSLCGSVGTFQDFTDSDFGSIRSPRVGDVGSLESFSLGGKFERKFESKSSLALGKLGNYGQRSESHDVITGSKERNNGNLEQRLMTMENEMHLYDEMDDLPDEGGVQMWKDNISSKRMPSTSTDKSLSAETTEEHMENVGVEEGSESFMGVDQVNNVFEGGRHLDECSEGEISSHLEHSESEGSMYGYGSDNEEQAGGLPPRGYVHYSPEKKSNSDDTLFMTSSIAYGADDWNDFTQETMETPQDLFVIDEIQGHNQNGIQSEGHTSKSTYTQKQEYVKDLHVDNQIDVSCDSPTYSMTHSMSHIDLLKHEEDTLAIGKQAEDINQFKMEEVTRVEKVPLMDVLHTKPEVTKSSETTHDLTFGDVSLSLTQDVEDHVAETPKDHKPYSLPSLPTINVEKRQNVTPAPLDVPEDLEMASKVESYELNEFYDEVVYEMEEILLDSGESPAARFNRGRNHHSHSNVSLPSRDGSSTASTSTLNNSPSFLQNPYKIDGIQVIGASQKKGDVSLGERLVGVKEYTVYKLRVFSGPHQWEVERRYRDFFTLYRRLKTSFSNKGWELPSPWSTVDRESRKYFGNVSPGVVSERSVLIQECLQSILNSKFSSSLPTSIIWFLSPPNNSPISPVSHSQNLGQSISLIVEIRPHKSMRQMLEAQHYTCAGCHKHFDDGKTRLWEFVQTLGWGKPRVCEYSGQVFCSNCHLNETAILPARVLHWWDFTEYPVSQLAKSYLDSTHDKPMLCVSAVNPFLFSKVPPLQHVINVRKRIGRMLPYVRCPFRMSIYKGVGSRRYILESSDFFALKDLVDLSKGIFSALPVMVETISKKIVDHITDECLICYDVGVPCGARQACDDPSSLIFPFQEGEVERCKSCELVYHKACFKKMDTCPCGVHLGARSIRSTNDVSAPPNNLVQQGTESKSSIGFLSGLLSKASSSKFWGHKENDTVIPMGSLPSSSR
ncbi:uncharacterized protein LOC111900688 [Lactuca sativa]|uniref:PX domain-containing protein n=1 Tax=Lactuca sativa TaxID=4236 RepID=A0A9R1VAV4_LACSA|nr:uncharacterized protein LOC111900688 [Lactuca sativa]KAJ0203632.1 hypothetical protein LSAT_V11C500234460 [Lactuca sativa]